MPSSPAEQPLLTIEDVHVHYGASRHFVKAVNGVTFDVRLGESVGLVGESGCGKTTLGRAIMRMTDIHSGQILFQNQDITELAGSALKQYRKQVQMVFQDPYGSLNARMSVGKAIEEVLHVHGMKDRNQRHKKARQLFEAVGLDPAYMDRYPHEFSGGQRQRIGIARSLAVDPCLLIADEPVSALDVSVQVQILNLLKDIQKTMNLALLFVAHDLAVVRYVCDRILVMNQGRVVESGSPQKLFTDPQHPYTRTLLAAVPDVEKGLAKRRVTSSQTASASAT